MKRLLSAFAVSFLLAAGCLGSSGPPQIASESVNDFGWIHIRATPDSNGDMNFKAEMTLTLDPPDAEAKVYLAYLGIPMKGAGGGIPSSPRSCAWFRTHEERCGKWPEWKLSFDDETARGFYDTYQTKTAPFNFFLALPIQGKPNARLTFSADENTSLEYRHGSTADTFLVWEEEFRRGPDGSLHYYIDVPSGKKLAFEFDTAAGNGTPGPQPALHDSWAFYERPDGSQVALKRRMESEFDGAPGRWRFEIPPDMRPIPKAPVLWGAFYQPVS